MGMGPVAGKVVESVGPVGLGPGEQWQMGGCWVALGLGPFLGSKSPWPSRGEATSFRGQA